MRLQVVAFTKKDWMQFAALLTAETALIWLAANVLFKPLDVTGRGLSVLAVVVLYVFSPSAANIVLVLAITRIPVYLRTARAESSELAVASSAPSGLNATCRT